MVALAFINLNLKCEYVAGKIGDSTIHTHTHIHTQYALTIFAYICIKIIHTHTVTNYTHSLVM